VEVITKNDKGLLNDLGIWCRATGHELLGKQPGEGEARLLIRKGELGATTGR
jgi:TusA-related sulfurtransferase